MKRTHIKSLFVLSLVAAFFVAHWAGVIRAHASSSSTSPAAMTRDDLTQQIQDKAKQLETINQQMESTKQDLQGTKTQRVTLQKQLSSIDSNISQLGLS